MLEEVYFDMSVYHQMGHHSANLLSDNNLQKYTGAILSPVNYNEEEVFAQVESKPKTNFEMIIDPQMYYPRSERGKLREWRYFPSDVDTTDLHSKTWWHKIINLIIETSVWIKVNSVCSPVLAPRIYTDEYYLEMVDLGNYFAAKLHGTGIKPIQTVLVNIADLSDPSRVLKIASIISKTNAEDIYLILVSNIPPRRELSDTEEIKGAMKLINVLETAELNVIVGYSSSDMVLWKAAGAKSCATGKFFNLRRFTSSRFEEPSEGGGQLPYWFEESLMAFLRESDLIRVRNADLLSDSSKNNPFGKEILQNLKESPDKSWLGLSWRQYLYAFADLEERIDQGLDISTILKEAETTWLKIEDKKILMEEMRNNGDWIRSWRRAVLEYNNF
jgi:hypothetical protein